MTNPAGAIRTEAERNLALLSYGLLGVSVFFAGITALVAVIIAYSLHNAATEELSRHFRFQTRIFWVGVVCILVTIVAAIVATLGAAGNLLHTAPPPDLVRTMEVFGYPVDLSGLRLTPLVMTALAISAGSALFGALWMMLASAFGFIRLASSKHIGQTAHP